MISVVWKPSLKLNEKAKPWKVTTESDFQLEQLIEILISAF